MTILTSKRQTHLVMGLMLLSVGTFGTMGCESKEAAAPATATTQTATTATTGSQSDAVAKAAQQKLDDERGRESQAANARTQ